jgi:hypothetical protein
MAMINLDDLILKDLILKIGINFWDRGPTDLSMGMD